MRPDVVIVGAGPAGSAAAIRLARTGRRVRVYEKTVFPRAKLCGGFLSPESLHDLEDLNVHDHLTRLNPPRINRSVVISQKGTRIENTLSEPAYSVSRDSFDQILVDQATALGVELMWGQDGFSHLDEAPLSVIAAGRLHRDSRSLAAEPLEPWYSGSEVRYVGIQALFHETQGITDQVELDLVSSGYVGLARQQDGVNVCALTTEEELQRRGFNIDNLLRHFISENAALKRHLERAARVSPWISVGPVRMGIRKLTDKNTFYVGDAACVVDPFAGEGMAMGLYASRLLINALRLQPKASERTYEALWKRAYLPALRWNAFTRALYSVSLFREPALRLLQRFPRGMTHLTDLTRYRELDDLNLEGSFS